MQYILVKFRTVRDVVVDDHFLGSTNQVIELEEGKHSISLGAPYDYSPHVWQVTLVNTTVVQPYEIAFR